MKPSKINLFGIWKLGFGIFILLATITTFLPIPAQAQAALPDLLPACAATGACRVCDIVNIFITLGRWLIAGAAGLALLVIVFAGSNIVTSAGNSEKVGAAKKQIVGAVLGLGLVLIAFQLVSFIIFALTTPAAQQNFTTSQVPASDAPSKQNLGSFLLGVPWWKICDIKELVASGSQSNGKGLAFPSTASCAYWGDGTVCSKSGASKCCRGLCTAAECVTDKIVEPVAQPGTTPATPQPTPTVPGSVVCGLPYNEAEQAARQKISQSGSISINNNGQWCGSSSYQAHRDTCKSGCTNVGGLQSRIYDYLETIRLNCTGFTITGGSELGHSERGGHSQGLAIDLVPRNYDNFGKCLIANINNFKFNFIRSICTTPRYSKYRHICNYNETEEHFHLSF